MFKRLSCLAALVVCLALAAGAVLASPYPFLALGDNAYAASDYASAESLYDWAVSLAFLPDPQAQALWGRAQARAGLGSYEPAVADYSALLAGAPGRTEAYARRGFARMQLKQYAESLSDLTAYLDADPGQMEQIAQRGFVQLKLKHYPEAIKDLSAYLAAVPDQPEQLAQRGHAELALNILDDAIADLQVAVNLKTADMAYDRGRLAEAYYRRAQAAVKREDYKAMAADLALGFFADATRPEMHTLRAFADLQLANFDAAVTDSSDAISLDNDAMDAYAYRAVAYAESGQWKPSVADAARALSAPALDKRERSLALYARAMATEAQGQSQASIKDASDALALGALDVAHTIVAYLVRASAQSELEAYKEASADYEAALQLKSPSRLLPTMLSGAGWAHLMLEENGEAVKDFTAAMAYSPNDGWLYAQRGLAQAGNKQYASAIADYDRALSLNA